MYLTKNAGFSTKEVLVITDALLLWAQEVDQFTVGGFCKLTGHKDNRHTRRILNMLVWGGLAFKAKQLFDDGHYRMVYSRQKTMPMNLAA